MDKTTRASVRCIRSCPLFLGERALFDSPQRLEYTLEPRMFKDSSEKSLCSHFFDANLSVKVLLKTLVRDLFSVESFKENK